MARYFRFPFAVSGTRAAVPDPVQVGGEVSFTQGYGPDYSRNRISDPLAKLVERTKQNQLFFDITSGIKQYQEFGTPDFITTADNGGTAYSYAAGSRVLYDAGSGLEVYQSKINSNNTLPTVSANWQKITGNVGYLNVANTWSAAQAFGALSGTLTGALVGNASTATALATSRSIYGGSFNGTSDLAGPVGAAFGGSGVANNAAATTTRVGNFAKTETLTAVTNVTYPTTGTLATRAGTETFTNKTLTAAAIVSGLSFTNSAQAGTTVLDWYEEGTFTPVLIGLGTAGVGTYSVQTGIYVRIGNVVFFGIRLGWTAHTGTGNMTFTGMPFTANAVSISSMSVVWNNLTITAGLAGAVVVGGSTQIFPYFLPTAGGAIAGIGMDVASDVYIQGSYFL